MKKALAELRNHLGSITTFTDEAWGNATPSFAAQQYVPEEHIIQAGTATPLVFFITQGIARYYYLTPDGKEFNKSFATTGQTIGSITSYINHSPSPFNVQALTYTECLAIPYQILNTLTETHAEWMKLKIHFLEQLAIKKETREADFLLFNAEHRYEKFLEYFSHIKQQLPNYHIASYLGITEVALSRIRRRMGLTS